jgi:hypothetical protein
MRKHRLKHSILWILLENAVAMLAAFILIAVARRAGGPGDDREPAPVASPT